MSGRYQIMEKIGQGGTGIVYKAYDHNLQKYVVVKKIKDNFVDSLNNRMEVDILKRLHHPYLPQVYDFLVLGHQVFTVMDFVRGKELQWYISHGYVIDEKKIRKWGEQLLEVLDYLHSQVPPIIHGDIKPANIMVTDDQNICLIDFNISLGEGDLSLIYGISEAYAAPEQIRKMTLAKAGQVHQMIRLDQRTDIYSLGKTLYVQMEYGKNRGVEYSQALWEIMGKAMSESPEERYQSAEKMLHVLRNIEKTDRDYRRYSMYNFLIHCGYAVCMVAAVCMIIFGIRSNQKEEYAQARSLLGEYAKGEEAELITQQGLLLLNTAEFSRVEKRDPQEAAIIFHTVGDGYYLQQDYGEAVTYYELALEKIEDSDEQGTADESSRQQYYTDLGIAFARDGKADEALDVMYHAEEEGVPEDYCSLIRSETAVSQGETEEGIHILSEICGNTGDENVKVQAYILMSDIYEGEEEPARAVECMKLAGEVKESDIIWRRLGNLYYKAGNMKEAANCFETLIKQYDPSYADCINYAVCCEAGGNFGAGQNILREMTERYPNRYEAYMHLAFSNYKLGRNATAKEYYIRARELFGNGEDAMMDELEHTYGQEGEEK